MQELIEKYKDLKAPKGRIIIIADKEYKNQVSLGDSGTVLKLQRDVENFDRKYTAPTQGFVISGKDLLQGEEILFNHNSIHDTNKIFSFEEEIEDNNISIYSIPTFDCYVHRIGEEWQPCEGFILGLRIYEPYKGTFINVEPKLLKNYLYVTSDCELKGKVVKTLNASLYEIIYNNKQLKEERLIRVRHSIDPNYDREEIVMIDNDLTKKVKNGELLIGLDNKNCKKL